MNLFSRLMFGCVVVALVCAMDGSAAQQPSIQTTSSDDLRAVTRIYVESFGDGGAAQQIQAMVVSALVQTKRFRVTENRETADAILKGTATELTSQELHANSEATSRAAGVVTGGAMGNQASVVGVAGAASDSQAALSTETVFNARLAVRLVNKAGDVIWATSQDTTGSKYRAATTDLADKTVAQLMRDANRSTTNSATPPATPITPAGRNQVIRNAKTLVITVEGDPAMEAEITNKLLAWGRIGLVSSSGKADLSLAVTQTGKFNMMKYGSAVTAAAELRDSESGNVIWSTTKGGFWSMSGASTRQVGGQIAGDLIKFLDSALKSK